MVSAIRIWVVVSANGKRVLARARNKGDAMRLVVNATDALIVV